MAVMAMSQNPEGHAPHANPEEGTSEWVTGDEPVTGAQHCYCTHSRKRPRAKYLKGKRGLSPPT